MMLKFASLERNDILKKNLIWTNFWRPQVIMQGI